MLVGEVLDQRRNIIDALAQRSYDDQNHVQPVKEIVLEPPLVDESSEVATFTRRLLEPALRISSVACETARTHGQSPPVARVPVLSVLALAAST
jgi:hypothetical protein